MLGPAVLSPAIAAFLGSFAFQETCKLPSSMTALFYIPFNDDVLLPHGLAGIWHCFYGFLVPGEGPEGLTETRGIKVPGATNQTGPEERAAPARGDTGSESLACDDPHPHAQAPTPGPGPGPAPTLAQGPGEPALSSVPLLLVPEPRLVSFCF